MAFPLIGGDKGPLMFCCGGEEMMIEGGKGSPLKIFFAVRDESPSVAKMRRVDDLNSLISWPGWGERVLFRVVLD